MSERNGVIKWFNRLKGYGYIEDGESGQDVFVHVTAIQENETKNLYAGDRVQYVMVDHGRGPQAQNVRPQYFY